MTITNRGLTLDFMIEHQKFEREMRIEEDARSAQLRAETNFKELDSKSKTWYHSHINHTKIMEEMNAEIAGLKSEIEKKDWDIEHQKSYVTITKDEYRIKAARQEKLMSE